jgi:bla regulator protein BlaR1
VPNRSKPSLFAALLFAITLLLAHPAPAQLAHKGPAAAIALAKTVAPYDVATIKQNKSVEQSGGIQVHDNVFLASNVTLEFILQFVYDIKGDRITGLTGPVTSLHLDVTAKVLPSADGTQPKRTDSQLLAMMIPLLADRFHLKAHVEPKIASVYDLVVAKGGVKLKLDPSERTGSNWNMGGENTDKVLTAKSVSMDDLANILSDETERTVINKTGLTGHSDITLKWSDEVAVTQGDANSVSIFTAIQDQLGLKLQPSKGPVDSLVIDHVEMPSEN